ncbi:MAG: hypothetical protein QMD23_07260 [Candidatus Bathyarchaeia archaeon]|nr:hypothetical protein [Candidatus Bathyarchaeia archaeon]
MACISMLPRVIALQKREMDEQLAKAVEETDFSELLRLKEFLKLTGLLKLARKWGVWKAAGIYSIFVAILIAVVSTVLSAFNIINVFVALSGTASAAGWTFIHFSHLISKALEKIEQSL